MHYSNFSSGGKTFWRFFDDLGGASSAAPAVDPGQLPGAPSLAEAGTVHGGEGQGGAFLSSQLFSGGAGRRVQKALRSGRVLLANRLFMDHAFRAGRRKFIQQQSSSSSADCPWWRQVQWCPECLVLLQLGLRECGEGGCCPSCGVQFDYFEEVNPLAFEPDYRRFRPRPSWQTWNGKRRKGGGR